MYVLNDIHLGVKRTAGTTASSQAALADWQFLQVAQLLVKCRGKLLINGDLFDTFEVDNATLMRAVTLFDAWLGTEGNEELVLSAGNHDLAKDSSKLSSLLLLYTVLDRMHPGKVRCVTLGSRCGDAYVIPHMANQDLFDAELKVVPPDAKYVLLHCNYDNHFAEQSDHSLNLTEAQAEKLPGFIVLGHEHQHRYAIDERLIVVGNQVPTSIADCLGPDFKYVAYLDSAVEGVRLEPCLDVRTIFQKVDWRDLGKGETAAKFIRVEGHAQAAEAAQVITAIAKFRAQSEAFVVTNAVEIEGANIMAGVVESLESAKSFDVLEAIFSILTDTERDIVRRLMGAA